MHSAAPELFFDFDNTITQEDVLDRVIERYSASDAWRIWEAQWQSGTMTTVECLERQVGGLRISLADLCDVVASTALDPAFAEIVQWARIRGVDIHIVSDNFAPLIDAVLRAHHLAGMRVSANELHDRGGRLLPRFPLRDPACARCAHCKAQHLRASAARPRIFVGDGLSDVCAALVGDVVFAKDSLATELTRRRVAFRSYDSLDVVLRYLEAQHWMASGR